MSSSVAVTIPANAGDVGVDDGVDVLVDVDGDAGLVESSGSSVSNWDASSDGGSSRAAGTAYDR